MFIDAMSLLSSSSSSDFETLGNLLDPTPEDIARNAERSARWAKALAEAEKAKADLEALIAHKARWNAMTRAERKEAMEADYEDECEG